MNSLLQQILHTLFIQGNELFHVDSSFNPRRAGYRMLLANKLPSVGYGGQHRRAGWGFEAGAVRTELHSGALDASFTQAHHTGVLR
ncbi:hypothetical protein BGW36DRAFT_370739 [Talaromyces proteolyticus]|uniref:Uncharacterized protein n=1 Tax=Talaromyces proteolyticus TaxID=1131652 RepID=A0AAD4Q5F5_9EURO|nr:uncharacterized protein BGW36DRAFT_370739 [Talaromyces proteolyticus]KAH8704149.1 hypothetical protein BGW36DRAFT_370739 [Talaromyces proteolyticus]